MISFLLLSSSYQSPDPDYKEEEEDKGPCYGKGIFKIFQCLVQSAIAASKAEYALQLEAAKDDAKLLKKLTKNEAKVMANTERHVNNYMTKMANSISRCGRGFSAEFDDAFYKQMKAASKSKSAVKMFKIWNLFASHTMTGDGVSCAWYEQGAGAEGLEESSFPCRTRRLFLKMLGKTQYGQYTECKPEAFDINNNDLF